MRSSPIHCVLDFIFFIACLSLIRCTALLDISVYSAKKQNAKRFLSTRIAFSQSLTASVGICQYWTIHRLGIHQLMKSMKSVKTNEICFIVSFWPIVLLHSMIGCWQRPVVRLSVCDAVYCGSQGWCTRLKLTPTCS